MKMKELHTITGTVEKMKGKYIHLTDTVFTYPDASVLEHFTKIDVRESYQTATLKLQIGDEVEINAQFTPESCETYPIKKLIVFNSIENIRKLNSTYETIIPPRVYDTNHARNETLEISELSMEEILGKDHPHLQHVLEYINDGYKFTKNLEKGMNIIHTTKDMPKQYAYNILKSTRVGASTSLIISYLLHNMSVVVFVPTNDIADTYEKAFNEYMRMTGDNIKTFRKFQSNRRGCAITKSKIDKNDSLKVIPFLLRDFYCVKCGIQSVVPDTLFSENPPQLHPILPEGDKQQCMQKAIVDELMYLKKKD